MVEIMQSSILALAKMRQEAAMVGDEEGNVGQHARGRGQELRTIASMKMETAVASSVDGDVAAIQATPGDTVDTGSVPIAFK